MEVLVNANLNISDFSNHNIESINLQQFDEDLKTLNTDINFVDVFSESFANIDSTETTVDVNDCQDTLAFCDNTSLNQGSVFEDSNLSLHKVDEKISLKEDYEEGLREDYEGVLKEDYEEEKENVKIQDYYNYYNIAIADNPDVSIYYSNYSINFAIKDSSDNLISNDNNDGIINDFSKSMDCNYENDSYSVYNSEDGINEKIVDFFNKSETNIKVIDNISHSSTPIKYSISNDQLFNAGDFDPLNNIDNAIDYNEVMNYEGDQSIKIEGHTSLNAQNFVTLGAVDQDRLLTISITEIPMHNINISEYVNKLNSNKSSEIEFSSTSDDNDSVEEFLSDTDGKTIKELGIELLDNNISKNTDIKLINSNQVVQENIPLPEIDLSSNIIHTNNMKEFIPEVYVNDSELLQEHFDRQINNLEHASTSAVTKITYDINDKISQGNDHFSIQLYPESLGKINVSLKIGTAGYANIAISCETQDAMDILSQDTESIRSVFENNDINVNDLSFDLNMDNNNDSHSELYRDIIFDNIASSITQDSVNVVDINKVLIRNTNQNQVSNISVDVMI